MKILCPTDLSPEANNAVVYAAKLAQQSASSLTLLNVQILAELTPVEALLGEEANMKNAQDVLDEQSMEISRLFRIDCRAVVLSSLVSLTSMITNEAKDYHLIVMGTDGPDNIIESMTGSKTFQVSSVVDLPILIIPIGVGYSRIEKILFAFDYRRVPEVPMKHAASFAQLLKAELTLLQVIEESWTRQIETEILMAQKQIRNSWPDSTSLKFETIYADNHDKSIKENIGRFGADVVAIGYHKQSTLGSIFRKGKTRQIIAGASYPLLVVHS